MFLTYLRKAVTRNLLGMCFLPFLPVIFPSLSSPSPLFLASKWPLKSSYGICGSAVSSPSGEERHLQPPDTFPGLQIHRKCVCGRAGPGGKGIFGVWWLQCRRISVKRKLTSSSAIAEKPRCSVGQFWVTITPYSADRPISIKSNQIEIID